MKWLVENQYQGDKLMRIYSKKETKIEGFLDICYLGK